MSSAPAAGCRGARAAATLTHPGVLRGGAQAGNIKEASVPLGPAFAPGPGAEIPARVT